MSSPPQLTRTPPIARPRFYITLDTLCPTQIKFTRAVIAGQKTLASDSAFSPSGQTGLATKLEQVAPDLAGDLLKAGVGGVANYVQGLANTRQISTNGATTPVAAQVPGLLEQIGGAVASALSAGRGTTQIALVGVASVERDTPLGILFGV